MQTSVCGATSSMAMESGKKGQKCVTATPPLGDCFLKVSSHFWVHVLGKVRATMDQRSLCYTVSIGKWYTGLG